MNKKAMGVREHCSILTVKDGTTTGSRPHYRAGSSCSARSLLSHDRFYSQRL